MLYAQDLESACHEANTLTKQLASSPEPGISDESLPSVEGRAWIRRLLAYREPVLARSLFELGVTSLALVALWVAMWWSLSISYWLTLAISIPAGGLMVRLFIIQHDCGHGSFFKQKFLNDSTGWILGVLTMTPYDFWKRSHSIHHATSGNLDRRGIGDITTLTVREYLELSPFRRFVYRLYRHPLILLGLGPAYMFLIRHRLPIGLFHMSAATWTSTMATNLAFALFALMMMWWIGIAPFILIHLPIIVLAATYGVWLFYVQHQFEGTVWLRDGEWDMSTAALHGSSYYVLPPVLNWFSGNIGLHHIHHLCSRIPFYRLPQVMRENPELANIGRLTLRESFGCINLALWDEVHQKMVRFRDVKLPQTSTERLPPEGAQTSSL